MIVAIAAFNVENHPQNHLLDLRSVFTEHGSQFQQVLVIKATVAMRRMKQPACTMDVDFPGRGAVETFHAEETFPVLGRKEVRFRHDDSGSFRRKRITVLQFAEIAAILFFRKFNHPRREPVRTDRAPMNNPRAVVRHIRGDFRARTAGRTIEFQKFVQNVGLFPLKNILNFSGKRIQFNIAQSIG